MFLSFSLRSARLHPARALLTLFSIILSVSTVTAVGKNIAGARQAYNRLSSAVAREAQLIIASRTGDGVRSEVLPLLRQMAGVKQVLPVSRNATILYAPGNRLRVVAVGIEPQAVAAARDTVLVEGRGLSTEAELLIDEQLARQLNIGVGDAVKLLTRSGMKTLPVVGLVRSTGAAAMSGTTVVLLPLEQIPRLFRRARSIDSLEIVLTADTEVSTAAEALRKELSNGFPELDVRLPESNELLAMDSLRTIETGLRLAGTLAFVVAAFMVLNAFVLNLGERRRQLALLRTVGASRGQVLAMVLGEAAVLGLAGTAIGVPAGVGVSWLLDRTMEIALLIPVEGSRLNLATASTAVAVGVLGTLAAALYPAWKATSVHPLEALRPALAGERSRPAWWSGIVASLLLAFAAAAWFVSERSGQTPTLVYLASAAFIIGLVFAIPPMLVPASRLATAPLSRWIGLPADLARRQIISHPLRATMTIGIVFVGMASGVAISNTLKIHIRNVYSWWDQSFVYGYYLRAMMPDLSMTTSVVVPPDLQDDLAAIPGVRGVETLRLLSVSADDQRVILFVRSYVSMARLNLDLIEGQPTEALTGLQHGGVVVGSAFAYRHNIRIGSDVVFQTEQGPQSLKAVAISSEYIGGGNVLHIDRDAAKKLFDFEGADVYAVDVRPEDQAAAEPRLRKLAEAQGLLLLSLGDMTAKVDRMTLAVTASLWGLLIVGLLIVAFGVSTTISMNVLEQTRELTLLRVVGSSHWQIVQVVISQAAIILILGVAPAVAAGLWVCYITNRSSLAISGFQTPFAIDVPMLVGLVSTVTLMVLAASLGPARRAARTATLIPPCE